jgi:hypothetical protein
MQYHQIGVEIGCRWIGAGIGTKIYDYSGQHYRTRSYARLWMSAEKTSLRCNRQLKPRGWLCFGVLKRAVCFCFEIPQQDWRSQIETKKIYSCVRRSSLLFVCTLPHHFSDRLQHSLLHFSFFAPHFPPFLLLPPSASRLKCSLVPCQSQIILCPVQNTPLLFIFTPSWLTLYRHRSPLVQTKWTRILWTVIVDMAHRLNLVHHHPFHVHRTCLVKQHMLPWRTLPKMFLLPHRMAIHHLPSSRSLKLITIPLLPQNIPLRHFHIRLVRPILKSTSPTQVLLSVRI